MYKPADVDTRLGTVIVLNIKWTASKSELYGALKVYLYLHDYQTRLGWILQE